MLLLTVIVLMAMFMFSYLIFDRELSAPPSVVCLSFLFSALCALYNENKWALDFSIETLLVMTIGIASFLLGGLLAAFLANRRKMQYVGFSHQSSSIRYIDIEKWKVTIVITFQVFVVLMIYLELTQKVGLTGITWSEVVHIYRQQSVQFAGTDYFMRLSGLTAQFIQINSALVFLFSYILGNNLACKKKSPLSYWGVFSLGCIITFMQGFRADMLRYWIALLVVWYTLHERSIGWIFDKETKQIIKKILVSALIVGVVFASVHVMVGRGNTDENWDPFYYVTFYGGCPVAAFDLYLKDPNPENISDLWGQETFYYLNQNIGAWLNMPERRYSIANKGFRQSKNGTIVGNVYTALRHPIADFGYIGLPVVMFIMGCFFTFVYCKVRKKCSKNKIDFLLLIYSYLAYTFFMYFFSAYYFFVSTTFIKVLLLWYILRKFLMTRIVFITH